MSESHQAIEPPPIILESWRDAAASIGGSFGSYWPSDPGGLSDPCEANVTAHFAHALLSRGAAVMCEIPFPRLPGENAQSLDLLGIASDRSWFVAAEFKRLMNGGGTWGVNHDLDRLTVFTMNPAMPREWCDAGAVRDLCEKATGWGLVGGLAHARNDRGAWLDTWRGEGSRDELTKLVGRIREMGGALLKPQLVRKYESTSSAYWLLGAMVPIARRPERAPDCCRE